MFAPSRRCTGIRSWSSCLLRAGHTVKSRRTPSYRCASTSHTEASHPQADPNRFRGTAAEPFVWDDKRRAVELPDDYKEVNTYVKLEMRPTTAASQDGVGVFAGEDIKKGSIVTQYGKKPRRRDDPKISDYLEFFRHAPPSFGSDIVEPESFLGFCGKSWAGKVPSEVNPSKAVGHLIRDAVSLRVKAAATAVGQERKSIPALHEYILHNYEVPSIVAANVDTDSFKKERRMAVLATKDIPAGQELFLHWGPLRWFYLETNQTFRATGTTNYVLNSPWETLLYMSYVGAQGDAPAGHVQYSPGSDALEVHGPEGWADATQKDYRDILRTWLKVNEDDPWWDELVPRLKHENKLRPAWKRVSSMRELGVRGKLLFLFEHVLE